MSYQKVKLASLDLILSANGKKTIDEMRFDQQAEKKNQLEKIRKIEPRPLTAQERKSLKRVMAKAGLDIFGNPLESNES